jgi:hypothetical protein
LLQDQQEENNEIRRKARERQYLLEQDSKLIQGKTEEVAEIIDSLQLNLLEEFNENAKNLVVPFEANAASTKCIQFHHRKMTDTNEGHALTNGRHSESSPSEGITSQMAMAQVSLKRDSSGVGIRCVVCLPFKTTYTTLFNVHHLSFVISNFSMSSVMLLRANG